MQRVMNLHDPGFLQTLGFSTEFAKYTGAVSSASVDLVTMCVMIPEIQC